MKRKVLLIPALLCAFLLSHLFAGTAQAQLNCTQFRNAFSVTQDPSDVGHILDASKERTSGSTFVLNKQRLTMLESHLGYYRLYIRPAGSSSETYMAQGNRDGVASIREEETLQLWAGSWEAELEEVDTSVQPAKQTSCKTTFVVRSNPDMAQPNRPDNAPSAVSCTPSVSPSRIEPNSSAPQTVSFVLDTSKQPAGTSPTLCQGDDAVAGCWQIRWCNLTGAFNACDNDKNHAVANQRIEGNKIVGHPEPADTSRRFWLEMGTGNSSGYILSGDKARFRNIDACGVRNGGVEITVASDRSPYCDGAFSISTESGGRYDSSQKLNVSFDGLRSFGFFRGSYRLGYSKADGSDYVAMGEVGTSGGSLGGWNGSIGPLQPGNWRVMVVDNNALGSEIYCASNFNVCDAKDRACNSKGVTDTINNKESAFTGTQRVDAFDYCKQAPAGAQREACIACVGQTDTGGQQKQYTAFGCIGVSGKSLTMDLVRLMLGVVGGIALLSILAAAALLSISRGEVSRVKEAKELITAAVSGTLFIIFSIVILSFIGVNILRIPGLID